MQSFMVSPDTSSMARHLQMTRSTAPTHRNFYRSPKSSVFHFTENQRGPICLMSSLMLLQASESWSQVAAQQERNSLLFFILPLSLSFFIFGFFVDWKGNFETLCNGAAKVLKGGVRVWPAECVRAGRLEKRSPCCILSEWSPTWFHLWVPFTLSFSQFSSELPLPICHREAVCPLACSLFSFILTWMENSEDSEDRPCISVTTSRYKFNWQQQVFCRWQSLYSIDTWKWNSSRVSQQQWDGKNAHLHEICLQIIEKMFFFSCGTNVQMCPSDQIWMVLQLKLVLSESLALSALGGNVRSRDLQTPDSRIL